MDTRSGKHSVFLLHAHLVFVAKYRKAVFSQDMLCSLEEYFDEVCASFESGLVEFNGEKDHVHLLVNYPPKVSVSKLVNNLKGVSSRKLRLDYAESFSKIYWKGVL